MTESRRYSGVAMTLHWLIAIAVIVNWRMAETAEQAATQEEAGAIMGNHFALGMTILVLTLLRLAWRLVHRPPPLSDRLASWEKALARIVHTLFYVLLVGMPLAGWFAMSSYGRGIDVWGVFEWPALPVAENPDLAGQVFDIHAASGTAMLVLIGLHVLGVLKHMFIDRSGNLWRMLPVGQPRD